MRIKFFIILTATIACLAVDINSAQTKKDLALEKIGTLKEKYLNYIRLFTPDLQLKSECARIQKRFADIDEEIKQGNLSLIQEQITKLDSEIDMAYTAFRQRQRVTAITLFSSISNFGLMHFYFPLLPDTKNMGTPTTAEEKGENQNPCREMNEIFSKGYRAESENRFLEAIKYYSIFLDSECAAGEDGEHARKYIVGRQRFLEAQIKQLATSGPNSALTANIPSMADEVEAIAQTNPDWASPLIIMLKHASEQFPPSPPPVSQSSGFSAKTDMRPIPGEPSIPSQSIASSPRMFPLTLDVWQSAWGDFSDIQVLLEYLRQNRIQQINFNPGLGIDSKSWLGSKKKLTELTRKFYDAGIERMNFLYAELGYAIENYARMLAENPSLKIDTIIDDSEFTDRNRAGFERNLASVRKYGIRYGAFVTLESAGNSGVSDATRYWTLENADFPILMSYFSCDFETQKASLKKYLEYADSLGKQGVVGVAILLGGKHVGRELSCEKLLSREQLQVFLSQLHGWCKTHPSYGGLIVETDQKLPRWNVSIIDTGASR
jgi:hypothetical protein